MGVYVLFLQILINLQLFQYKKLFNFFFFKAPWPNLKYTLLYWRPESSVILLIEKEAIIKPKHLKKQKELQTSENNTVFRNKYKLVQPFCSLTIKNLKCSYIMIHKFHFQKQNLKRENTWVFKEIVKEREKRKENTLYTPSRGTRKIHSFHSPIFPKQ